VVVPSKPSNTSPGHESTVVAVAVFNTRMDAAAMEVARLVLRQDSGTPETLPDEEVTCGGENGYDGRMGIRISAIFVILIGSTFGKSSPLS
jgi:hypothetical protein